MRKFYPSRLRFVSAPFALVAIALLSTSYWGSVFLNRSRQECVLDQVPQPTLVTESFSNNSRLLRYDNGTPRFRDNLPRSPKEKFITAWTSSGWSNEVISAVNLIYIAMNVGRTPVLPPFMSTHFGPMSEVIPLRFGDVFDVPRLANKLGMHILEWHELKDTAPDHDAEVEKLGCWSVWPINPSENEEPRYSQIEEELKLDISYTPVPQHFSLEPGSHWLSLWKLASLSFPKSRKEALSSQASRTFSVRSGGYDRLEPDDQMMCFDTLYWIGLLKVEEWWDQYAPFWRSVGTHIHWNPSILELAQGYLRRHFNLQQDEAIPPFISVHVRRGDFQGWCPSGMSASDCLAPTSAYARRVQETKDALRERPGGLDVREVLVTSDESDPEWWKEIVALGPEWGWIDHTVEQTAEKHSVWYPVILDAVIHSLGAGFVGTDRSTVTLLAQRRVEDWNLGVSERVNWGAPHADDH